MANTTYLFPDSCSCRPSPPHAGCRLPAGLAIFTGTAGMVPDCPFVSVCPQPASVQLTVSISLCQAPVWRYLPPSEDRPWCGPPGPGVWPLLGTYTTSSSPPDCLAAGPCPAASCFCDSTPFAWDALPQGGELPWTGDHWPCALTLRGQSLSPGPGSSPMLSSPKAGAVSHLPLFPWCWGRHRPSTSVPETRLAEDLLNCPRGPPGLDGGGAEGSLQRPED